MTLKKWPNIQNVAKSHFLAERECWKFMRPWIIFFISCYSYEFLKVFGQDGGGNKCHQKLRTHFPHKWDLQVFQIFWRAPAICWQVVWRIRDCILVQQKRRNSKTPKICKNDSLRLYFCISKSRMKIYSSDTISTKT